MACGPHLLDCGLGPGGSGVGSGSGVGFGSGPGSGSGLGSGVGSGSGSPRWVCCGRGGLHFDFDFGFDFGYLTFFLIKSQVLSRSYIPIKYAIFSILHHTVKDIFKDIFRLIIQGQRP